MQSNRYDKPSSIIYSLVAIIVIYLCCFHNIWIAPISDVDEGAFSQATMEMLANDNYLSVSLLGEYRSDKPILTHWLQSISIKTFGFSEWAFRLPSSIAASIWLSFLGYFAARNFSRKHGLLTIIISGSCVGIMAISKAATADALFNLFLVLTIGLFYQYAKEDRRLFLYIASAFAGLGFLTKGPAAIAIPGLLFILYSFFNSDFRNAFLKSILSPIAWFIFLLFSLPWYAFIYISQGWEQFSEFFLYHNYIRFTQPLEGHDGGVLSYFFYLPVLIIFTMPYLGLLKDTIFDSGNYKLKSIGLFLFIWFLIVFVLFSVSATKLPHYLIYGMSPIFILLSDYALKKGPTTFLVLQTILMIIFYFSLPLILYFSALSQDQIIWSSLSNDVLSYFNYKYFLWLIIISSIYIYTVLNANLTRPDKISFSSISLIIVFSFLVYPSILGLLQSTQKEIGLRASIEEGDLVFYDIYNPSVSLYSRKIAIKRIPSSGDLVYTKRESLILLSNYEIIYENNGQFLLRMD